MFGYNASVISYRNTALNILFKKNKKGGICTCDHIRVRKLSAPGAWTLTGAGGRAPGILSKMLPSPDFSKQKTKETEGNCYFICVHKLGCNHLCHIGCQVTPLVKIKPIFQIQ